MIHNKKETDLDILEKSEIIFYINEFPKLKPGIALITQDNRETRDLLEKLKFKNFGDYYTKSGDQYNFHPPIVINLVEDATTYIKTQQYIKNNLMELYYHLDDSQKLQIWNLVTKILGETFI